MAQSVRWPEMAGGTRSWPSLATRLLAQMAVIVGVLVAGKIYLVWRVAEIGPVHDVINKPAHPYTAGLMASIPDMAVDREGLNHIDGAMPRLNAIPPGCAYTPRCPKAFDRCMAERPDLLDAGNTRAACWLHAGDSSAAYAAARSGVPA